MGGAVPEYLLKHPVYGRCCAWLAPETPYKWTVFCQKIYWNTLYMGVVVPDYLLKHPVNGRCCARIFTETPCIWVLLCLIISWNNL
jgi:hypothetical protein